MRAITLSAEFVIALGILSGAPMAHAPTLDLDSCHDDLDRLRRVAVDASDAAEEAIQRVRNSRTVGETQNRLTIVLAAALTMNPH